jgi:hypothetical protein
MATTSRPPETDIARVRRYSQRRAPERLGLGLADVQADHLTAAGLMDAVGDHQRLVAHPARLADPLHLGVHRYG